MTPHGYDSDQCERCTATGIARDEVGGWLCEECIFENTVADVYDDFHEDQEYGDQD